MLTYVLFVVLHLPYFVFSNLAVGKLNLQLGTRVDICSTVLV